MKKTTKTIVIILSVIGVIVIVGVYMFNSFFSAFAPPRVTITKNYISTNQDFINGVTIEKIRPDSMGKEGYPLKYTVTYSTSCNIQHPTNKPPDPPGRIEFYKPGKYSWDEDTVKLRYEHNGKSRTALDTPQTAWWLNKFGSYPICPLQFEKRQWYFITIGDPQVTGIFFYIDSSGKEHQYFLESGVSPI